jgi:hypothetical protein
MANYRTHRAQVSLLSMEPDFDLCAEARRSVENLVRARSKSIIEIVDAYVQEPICDQKIETSKVEEAVSIEIKNTENDENCTSSCIRRTRY